MTEIQTANQTPRDWLILLPTQLEMDLIAGQLSPEASTASEICGFGPIISAARTMQLITRYSPARVLLLGIAGTYLDDLPIGHATIFDQVACFGVGVGSQASFQTAEAMGWPQWPGDANNSPIGDLIQLTQPRKIDTAADVGIKKLLVTVTSSASDENEVATRLRIFPEAVAEDMEAFGVASACHLSGTPLFVVRGISNRAGDREKSNWKIKEALTAAVNLGLEIMKAET